MPSWDNTARRKQKGSIFLRSSPGAFAAWLRRAVEFTLQAQAPEDRLLFINAWNEWAEGCHLEPDQRYGYAWLNATRRVLGSWENGVLPEQEDRVLFISHDFAHAGAQLLLLRLLRWIRRTSTLKFDLLIAVPAEREERASAHERAILAGFRELAQVYFVNTASSQPTNLDEIRRGRYKLIYANTSTLGALLKLLQPFPCPVITHVHELRYWIEERMPVGAVAELNALTNHFIACSQAVADNLIQRQNVPIQKVEVIHAFTSLERAKEVRLQTDRAALRRSLNLPETCFVVVACGTLDWRKGPDLLVLTAEAFRRKNPGIEIRFHWIGSPTSPNGLNEIQSLIDKHRLSDGFELLGPMTDPLPWMFAADCFALPSREDPFPLVMLEAASMERAIVAFAGSGGAPELLADGAGLLAPHGDVGAFADHLAELQRIPGLRQRLGGEVAQRVMDQYSEEVLAPRILATIQRHAKMKRAHVPVARPVML